MIVPFGIKKNSTVFIAGCGGGFDVLSAGFPIGLALEKRGHRVVYGSYTFTNLSFVKNFERIKNPNGKIGSICSKVDRHSICENSYFPEKYLSEWHFEHRNMEMPVYCYSGQGVQTLVDLFNYIQELEEVDYLFIVDGGADGIMRGDEYDLATPTLDAISIIAGSLSEIKQSYYVLSAFGTEGVGKGFSHAEALHRMSDLIKSNQMLGVSSLLNDPSIKQDYLSLYDLVSEKMYKNDSSTIMGSIAESVKGVFGDTAVNNKTSFEPVWISPLTSLLWYFDLEGVAKMKLYYDDIKDTVYFHEAQQLFNGRGSFGKNYFKDPSTRPVIPV